MLIGGLQKTTLIDFPNTIACTVFTVGCNFRCPFCHNRDLVTGENFKKSGIRPVSEQSFFEFLKKRKKWLDGVCITGGEPTVWSDLPDFIHKIKKLGYKVKLDTNGTNPTMLKKLYQAKLLDYVAMDVKASFDEYQNTAKLKIKNEKLNIVKKNLKLSIKLMLKSEIGFEFRTTVVPGIHNKSKLKQLAKDLACIAVATGFRPSALSYYLQPFRPYHCLDANYLELKPFTRDEIQTLRKAVKTVLPSVKIRGDE